MAGPSRRRRGPVPASRRIEVRISEAEYEAIRQAAAAGPGRGVSVARFVVEAALVAARVGPSVGRTRRRGSSRLVLAEVVDAVTAVNRVGNNLNQLARERNITGHRPAGTFEQEQRARDALQRLAEIAERAVEQDQ